MMLTNNKFEDNELWNAICNNDLEKTEIALKNGANPNQINQITNDKRSPLFKATCYSSNKQLIPIMKLLLKYGADPNSINIHGKYEHSPIKNHTDYRLPIYNEIVKTLFEDGKVNYYLLDNAGIVTKCDTYRHNKIKFDLTATDISGTKTYPQDLTIGYQINELKLPIGVTISNIKLYETKTIDIIGCGFSNFCDIYFE